MLEYTQAKSILSPLKGGPDPYFGITYNMNLYRGCQHQCIYCDTRSKVYGVGDLSHIRVKKNAIDLLEQKIRSIKNKGTIGTGSMNDPYMPVEKDLNHTRRALEIIAQYNYPVHILTKSNLVLRDIDVIQKISKTYAAVSFTITTTKDSLAKKIEPGAPTPSERFEAIRRLSGKGIYTGIILSPVLPFISDTLENIKSIVEQGAKAGAKYVIAWMGMTMRDGQREYYYKKLDIHFPGIKEKYKNQFGANYNCPSPNSEILYEVFNKTCEQNNMARKMEFYSPDLPKQLHLF